jgi:hypothetical protein
MVIGRQGSHEGKVYKWKQHLSQASAPEPGDMTTRAYPSSILNGRWHLNRRCLREICLAILVLCAFSGCKSKDGGGGLFRGTGLGGSRDGFLTSRGDPLLGGARIPPQNLPIPRRSDNAARTRDPLLMPSPGSNGSNQADRTDRPADFGKETAGLAGRSREPFRPSRMQSNAALAGRILPDDNGLSIGDRPLSIQPTAGSDTGLPIQTADISNSPLGLSPNDLTQLRRLGATWTAPERSGDGVRFRCQLPMGPPRAPGAPGLVRQYEGFGPTTSAAVADAIQQYFSDMDRDTRP